MDVNNSSNSMRSSRLVNSHSRFDAPNDLEEKLSHHFSILQDKMEGKSEGEISTFLSTAAKTPGFNEVVSDGFLYGILTDVPNAKKHFANFFQYCMSVADGWYQALLKMNMVLLEIFYKLKSESRQQILFFFAESIRHNIPKIDNVLTNLLRTVSEGSDYRETCVMLHGISEILVANKEWMRGLKVGGTFAPVTLLSLSRFISDQHQQPINSSSDVNNSAAASTSNFKNAMISVCDFLLKERFSDLILLGRDLVLILMRLAKIPPFVSYWKALFQNPTSLSPKCNGIGQLMAAPCANILFSYRVSLHIGRKLEFMLKMRTLAQTKYLDWFHKAHLSSADSGSLRAEIIRYVWFNIQMPEFQQPWAIEVRAQFLFWLLKKARLGAETQWCKLMLFWDWFGFDPQVANSIQLVEPAFSLIRYSISTMPHYANSLLDYLNRTCLTLHPPLASEFVASVTAAFKALASAGMPVVSLLESPRLDKPVRDALRETFVELFPKKSAGSASTTNSLSHGACINGPGTSTAGLVNDLQEPGSIIDFDAIRGSTTVSGVITHLSSTALDLNQPSTSEHTIEKKALNNHNENSSFYSNSEKHSIDVTYESDAVKHKKKQSKKKHSSTSESENCQTLNFGSNSMPLPAINEYEQNDKPLSVFLPMVKEEFREHLEALSESVGPNSANNENACEVMQNLLMAIFEEEDGLDDEQSELVAECLLRIFDKFFKKCKFLPPEEFREDSLNEFFDGIPLYAFFRQMCMGSSDGDETRRPLLMVLSDMREKCGSIGYLFLFFIRGVRRDSSDSDAAAYSAYEELCRYLNKSVEVQIVEDLQQCALQDHELFAYLLPFAFEKLSVHQPSFVELMHLVCAHVDAKQLSDLVGEIIRENIALFRKDSFSSLLTNSLTWETVEQMILWHLIRAEGVPVEWMTNVIPRLNYSKHSEAATNILILLKSLDREPTMPLLRGIISRSCNDLFAVHALKVLIDSDDNLNKMAQMLNTLVKKLIASNEIMMSSSTRSGKSSEKNSKKTPSLTVHNVFSHLDMFRLNCLTKDSRRAETFLSSQPLQEIFSFSKRESKMIELRSCFSELFAVMEIFSDETNSNSRSHRKNRPRGCEPENHSGNSSEIKSKRRRIKEENSDEDER